MRSPSFEGTSDEVEEIGETSSSVNVRHSAEIWDDWIQDPILDDIAIVPNCIIA